MGGPEQALHRLAGDHPHRLDVAFGGGGHRIEPQQRAGRHNDLGIMRACELDQSVMAEDRTSAEHDHRLAGAQERLGNGRQQGGRRALDHDVGERFQLLQSDDGNRA